MQWIEVWEQLSAAQKEANEVNLLNKSVTKLWTSEVIQSNEDGSEQMVTEVNHFTKVLNEKRSLKAILCHKKNTSRLKALTDNTAEH